MGRPFRLNIVALTGAVVSWAIACTGSIPAGGHAGGIGGAGGVGPPVVSSDAGPDAGCGLPDGGCLGLNAVCSLTTPNACDTGLVCTLSTAAGVYTCQVSGGPDAGCDAGECYTLGDTCDVSNPDNGGCEEGLYCDPEIETTGVVYNCQTGIDAG